MKKTIGILYICTGPYILFWEDFYKSFEKKFLPNIEKKYYVFTDSKDIYGLENENVNRYDLSAQPWPLITLLRFSTFLSIEEEIEKCDYLMFSNANIVCDTLITQEEFLPREDLQEELFVTTHPGYQGKSNVRFPYDRNKKSLAYIPWNCGKDYVIGAMFGGTSRSFIKMSKILKKRIEEDLKNNIIAKWHDESHLNRYIVGRNDVRVLSPSYCYPVGMNVSYEKKISGVSKQAKFDVKTFKGQYDIKKNSLFKIWNKLLNIIILKERFFYLKDFLLNRKVKEIVDDK